MEEFDFRCIKFDVRCLEEMYWELFKRVNEYFYLEFRKEIWVGNEKLGIIISWVFLKLRKWVKLLRVFYMRNGLRIEFMKMLFLEDKVISKKFL